MTDSPRFARKSKKRRKGDGVYDERELGLGLELEGIL